MELADLNFAVRLFGKSIETSSSFLFLSLAGFGTFMFMFIAM